MEKDNQTAKGRVIIYLEGGLIQEIVSCDLPFEVIINDYDDTCDDDRIVYIDGMPVYLTQWEVIPNPEFISAYLKLRAAIEQDNPDTDADEKEEVEIEIFTCPVCNREVANLCDVCGVCGGCCTCSVDLLSAGYEWTCPICGEDNQVISIVEEVTCQKCGKKYPVDEANHSYD